MSTSRPSLHDNATRDLAAFAAGLRFEDIPKEVVEHAKLCFLDGIGVCLHGATLPWTRHVQAMVLEEGGGAAASLWGTGKKTSISQAVLVNATAGHAFEMDDIHKDSVLHPNSLATPIGLAFAEARGGLPGRDVITAVIAGYEAGTRVGNAATTDLFLRGFHPQGTSGTFVSVATAGHLNGLTAAQMQHAFGIAGSMGSGLMAAQEGAMVKRLHAGRAAQSGVYGALLAKRGFTGITDILEAGYGGFLSSFSGAPSPEKLTSGLGTSWETVNVGFKLYPCVTSIHTALDALQHIMAEYRLTAGEITGVEVGCGHMTYVHTAWPYKPVGITAAQMNMYYGLAVIALGGKASVVDYTEDRLQDPAILDFITRISVHEDPELEAMGPSCRHACRMTVSTRQGAQIRHEILKRRGSPENAVRAEDIEEKFKNNVRGCLTAAQTDAVLRLVNTFEKLASTEELTAILGAGRLGAASKVA